MSAPKGYSRRQIRLHWVIFALLIPQFILHDWIAEAWDIRMDGGTFSFHPLIAAHVFGGLLILALALWRLQVRLTRGVPPPPAEEDPKLQLVAKAVHIGLYAVLIFMPIGGAVAWFGGVELAAEGHEMMKFVLLGLFGLHVAGALYQQFVLKTNMMARMKRPQA